MLLREGPTQAELDETRHGTSWLEVEGGEQVREKVRSNFECFIHSRVGFAEGVVEEEGTLA